MINVLIQAGFDSARTYRFGHCGDDAWVMQHLDDPTRVKVAGSACHDRWCLPCAKMRSSVIASNLVKMTADRKLRLLTLTLHHRAVPLRQELDRLQESFVRLRHTPTWKQNVVGGVAVMEVARGAKNSTWHPHLHIIFEGRYVPQKKLKHLWKMITDDSYIVDIRSIESEAMLVNYVTKYVSKPWTGAVERSKPLMLEIVQAMDKRRLCTTFGSWRGMRLTVQPVSDEWENLGSLADFLYRAKRDDADALRILSQLDAALVKEALEWTPDVPPPTKDPPKQLFLFANATDQRF